VQPSMNSQAKENGRPILCCSVLTADNSIATTSWASEIQLSGVGRSVFIISIIGW